MKNVISLRGSRVLNGWRAGLLKFSALPILLTGIAAHANAGAVGVCVISAAYGVGGDSYAAYASAVVTAGCNPGFVTNILPGGTVNPISLPPGLTTATLTTTQTMPFGGISVATSTASLDQGVLREYADSQGVLGGTTTGGQGYGEALFGDNLHFTITDGAPSAIVTMHEHLDGVLGSEAGSNANNYNIVDQFGLGGDGCWESITGLGFAPCASGNFGYLTSSFSNQSPTGFDFTGTFQVTNGAVDPFYAALQLDCQGGEVCDFGHTAQFSLTLPTDVTFTSDSGVLFTQTAGSATPEPGSFGMLGAALLAIGILRRQSAVRKL